MRAGINAFRIPGNFSRICIRIEFEFIDQEHCSRMCICICYKVNSCEKREVRASNSKSMVLRIFSRMCMCIEFVIQVLKQKNARVSFPRAELKVTHLR